MKTKDYPDFLALLSSVFAFYKEKYSEFAGQVWLEAMKQFTFSDVKRAFSQHAINPDNGQFMPKPADLIRLLEGGTHEIALLAWSKFDHAVRSIGIYQSVVFDDPVIHAVVDQMGGWLRLNEKKESEWDFVRNEFVNRYRGYKSRHETPAYRKKLIGLAEASNTTHGFEHQEMVMIGDAKKCQQVFSGGEVFLPMEVNAALITCLNARV